MRVLVLSPNAASDRLLSGLREEGLVCDTASDFDDLPSTLAFSGPYDLVLLDLAAMDLATLDRFQGGADGIMRMLDNEVNRQAAMVAYIDDFYLMTWLALAAVPLAFVMRRSRPAAAH